MFVKKTFYSRGYHRYQLLRGEIVLYFELYLGALGSRYVLGNDNLSNHRHPPHCKK